MDDIRTAARLTAQAIRLRQLADQLAAEQARNDQLHAELRDLTLRVGRLERRHELRGITIRRLQGRLQGARLSRDLWKHRYRRDVT